MHVLQQSDKCYSTHSNKLLTSVSLKRVENFRKVIMACLRYSITAVTIMQQSEINY